MPTGRATVGPYTLLAKIGEGGMGVVHLARRDAGPPSTRSEVRVALKVLRPHIVGDDEARRRLAREVSSLGRIRSRWVAEIVDADPWAPVPYVATRYVPGLSLHDHVVEEGPVTGGDLLWFAGALAEGLASVHAAGVLHRDVKPSNVLMEGRTPILIDFGLARVADDPRLTHTGWLLGTPGYLAPEILYGDDATPASDLHSWGATVAFAATGAAPFGRGPSMAIMDRVRRGEHDLRGLAEAGGQALHDVVAAVLDPEPERRPSLDEVLAWLRPQTTRPAPLLSAPPTGGPGAPGVRPAPSVPSAPLHSAPTVHEPPDPFAAPLALAAQARAVPPPAPDWNDDATPTRVEPASEPERRAEVIPFPVARPTRVLAEDPPAPAWTAPAPGFAPPYPYPPPAPPPAPLAERVRRGVLLGAGAVAVGAAVALAPWVALAVVTVVVWLLRSGSLAGSAASARRQARGRRWHDGPQLLLRAPWHLAQSVPGAAMLLLWGGGLALAAALVCYAVVAPIPVTLFVTGLVLAPALWWGPGGSRLRGPVGRVVVPLSRGVGTWAVAVGLLLAVSLLTGAWVESSGTAWTPAADHPFSTR
ncbi:hypothetical protein GCM10023340_28050 [Nocardioides marinquilinus]|uniref:Protein kinase domain-containing protein n=1 Tax=Nocardioides marinquilinus TaxID=1210400 RepID=A0ABP9PR44_9ACTN